MPRKGISREQVMRGAVALADESGLESLSMRKLGQALGVEAMSLYNHVAGKEALLDGMVDLVFAEIDLPAGGDWKKSLRQRAISMRAALARHRWAVGLMESRTNPGVTTLRQHDAVIGCLLAAGFSMELTAHAFAAVDGYVYGFALQEKGLPFDTPEQTAEMAEAMLAHFPVEEFPHLAAFTRDHVMRPGYDFGEEFEFGLDLILDGLERITDR
jgi:AcrR family transcriptional regulator